MATKTPSARKRKSPPAQNSGQRPRKRPGAKGPKTSEAQLETLFKPGNPWRFEKGKSGNPGGRPALISDAYREWLKAEDEHGITNAAKVAMAQGLKATVSMDTQAARELRQATEGTRITTWQDDVVKLLREGQTTVEQVREELGDDIATELAAAAGLPIGEGGEDPPAGAEDAGS